MNKKDPLKYISSSILEYDKNIREDLRQLWNHLDIDLSKKEQYEVTFGIIARQVTLSIHFMSSISSWTNDIAPIILRSMADNYINLRWILISPLERSQQFIKYGLGQEKLMIEHRKNQISQEGGDPKADEIVKSSEIWINSQRYTFLTDVNLGNWANLNTREMAEQAGCLDFYNGIYQPFSSAVHNTWNYVGKYNVKTSDNILHKLLRKPFVPDIRPIITYIETSANFTNMCFNELYKYFQLTKKRKSAYEVLGKRLYTKNKNKGNA